MFPLQSSWCNHLGNAFCHLRWQFNSIFCPISSAIPQSPQPKNKLLYINRFIQEKFSHLAVSIGVYVANKIRCNYGNYWFKRSTVLYSYFYFKTNNFRAFCIKFSSAGEIWLCYLGCIAPNISHLAPKSAEITKDPQTGAAYVLYIYDTSS